jgi:hypothetical protein
VSSRTVFEEPSLILFLSANCGPCEQLAYEMGTTESPILPLHLIVIVEEEERDSTPYAPLPARILYQRNRAASSAFKSVATPQAFAVSAGGVVAGKAIPNSISDLRAISARLPEGGDSGFVAIGSASSH